jgi:hypothetical protein
MTQVLILLKMRIGLLPAFKSEDPEEKYLSFMWMSDWRIESDRLRLSRRQQVEQFERMSSMRHCQERI